VPPGIASVIGPSTDEGVGIRSEPSVGVVRCVTPDAAPRLGARPHLVRDVAVCTTTEI
jgi:hypothetical protein